MFTGELAQSSRAELVEEFVAQTKLALTLAIEARRGAHRHHRPHPEERPPTAFRGWRKRACETARAASG